MRTTIDLDVSILRELKRLRKSEGKSLGRLVSDLLAAALAGRRSPGRAQRPFRWIGRKMGARVNIADKDALHALLDRDGRP